MDRRMDGYTPSYRDAWTHLKINYHGKSAKKPKLSDKNSKAIHVILSYQQNTLI